MGMIRSRATYQTGQLQEKWPCFLIQILKNTISCAMVIYFNVLVIAWATTSYLKYVRLLHNLLRSTFLAFYFLRRSNNNKTSSSFDSGFFIAFKLSIWESSRRDPLLFMAHFATSLSDLLFRFVRNFETVISSSSLGMNLSDELVNVIMNYWAIA